MHFTKYSFISILGYKLSKTNLPENTAYGEVAIIVKLSIIVQFLPNFYQLY